MTLPWFVAVHAAVLVVVMIAAWAAGTLVAGARPGLAIRCAIGFAVWSQALFLLAAAGVLRGFPIAAIAMAAIAGAAIRQRGRPIAAPSAAVPFAMFCAAAVFSAVFLLALQPPLAFDETLYHLPYVRDLAVTGELRFLRDMRFPVFPQLHELLCVPLFLLAGDTATHLVSVAEALTAAALVAEGARHHAPRAAALAPALFAGSPIVLQLSTIGYVDSGLTLFVGAGFYCLDRARFEKGGWYAFAGFFFGTASGVKYLGWYFAVAALLIIVLTAGARSSAVFIVACAAAAAPTTAWLLSRTGNPVFPFLPQLFGRTLWMVPREPSIPLYERLARVFRVVWDVTFARERVNFAPPFTPFFAPCLLILAAAAVREGFARCVAVVVAVYLIVFSFLPQDSRYLVPTLPLLSVVAAIAVARRWPRATGWIAALAIAPGALYVVVRLWSSGLPPSSPEAREAWLTRRVPEYRALHRAEGPVYGCGAERLKYFARARYLGDHWGPWSFDRVVGGRRTTDSIAASLRHVGAGYFLLAKRACPPLQRNGGMELVYEDEAAQLWRVVPQGSNPRRP